VVAGVYGLQRKRRSTVFEIGGQFCDPKITLRAIRQHEMLLWSKKPMKAFANVLRVSLERRLRRVQLRGLPFALYYEPTMFCNLKCPSCPTGIGSLERPKKMVNPEEFNTTIGALADWVFTLYLYNWGEPLLHKDFAKLVKYATDKGIVVTASSNLSMRLTLEQCEEIVRSGLHLLVVGVDGASPAVHAMYRKGSNLELVHNNLRTLILVKEKLGSPTPIISVQYLVFAHNETEIEEFSKQMGEIGVNSYYLAPAWLPPNGTISMPQDPRYDMYKLVNESISKLRLQGRSLKPCTWLYYTSTINPGGTISACCGVLSESSDFGSLHPTDSPVEMGNQFRTEWNGDRYSAARELFSKGAQVERWASKNLRDLGPDGMAFSSKGVPMICAQCPIPHTLELWSQEVLRLYEAFWRLTRQCIKSLDLRGAAVNAIKAFILRLAVLLQ